MNDVLVTIKGFFGCLLTGLLYLLGGWDIALECLLIAMALDYISGISKAIYTKQLDSKTGIKGIIKKVGIILLIALSVILDRIIGNTGLIRTFVIYYTVANEGLSIVENLGAMNVLVPEIVKEKLKQLQKGSEEK